MVKLGLADPPSLTFATTAVGATSSDSPKSVTVINNGNADVTIPNLASGSNPSLSTSFALGSSSTFPQVYSTSFSQGTLVAGSSCVESISFTPTAGGAISGALVMTNNNFNAVYDMHSVPLSGVGVVPIAASTTNSTVITSPNPVLAGSSVIVAVTVNDSSNSPVTGATAIFSSNSSTADFGNPTTRGNVIQVTLTDTVAEVDQITVVLGGAASGTLTGPATFVAPAYVVTVATDPASGNGTPGTCVASGLTGENSNCTLRDAIAGTNGLPVATGSISFSGRVVGPAGKPAVIMLAQPTPLTITQSVSINGPGQTLLSIDGAMQTGVFAVTAGSVTFDSVTNTHGSSNSHGGAISNLAGVFPVSNSTISANTASATGGGISNDSGFVTILNSTLAGNSAPADGGAIYNAGKASATITVIGSTITGNSTKLGGGAIFNQSCSPQTITITNSYITGNSAGDGGGAIYTQGGGMTISNTTLVGNILTGGEGVSITNYGGPVAVSNSILSDSTYGVTLAPGSGNVTSGTTLSTLGSYGGPTQTLLPLPGSSAICAGVPSLVPPGVSTDQRSGPRAATYGGTSCVDAGAVQTNYGLGFTTQQPPTSTPVQPGVAMTPAPVITVTESGTPLTAGPASITVTDTASPSALDTSKSTLTAVTSSLTATPGQASFGNLIFRIPVSSDLLAATLSLNPALPTPLTLSATSTAFQVSLLPDPIAFSVPSHTYGDAPFALSATSNSDAPFTYTLVSGPATVSGSTLTITGAGTVVMQASQVAAGNYMAGSMQASFAVAPKLLSASIVGNPSKVYDTRSSAILTPANYQLVGLVGTDAITVTQTSGMYAAATAGPETVTAALTSSNFAATSGALGNYVLPASAVGTGTITKAPTSNTITWATPAPITYGTALSATQLKATSTVAGSFTYAPGSGTVLGAGLQTLNASFAPGDTVDYQSGSAMVTLQVNRATPAAITYGTALSGTQLNATVSVQGTLAYAPAAGTILGAGAQTLRVTFTPTDAVDYNSAMASVSIMVNKASTTTTLAVTTSQTVTGTSATFTATVKPQLQGTPTGTVTYLDGSTTLGTAAVGTPFTVSPLAAGSHSITAAYGGDPNFTGSSSTASMVVGVAPTTVILTPVLTRILYPSPLVYTVQVPLKGLLGFTSGTITIYDGATVIQSFQILPLGLNANIVLSLAPGVHNLRAVYGGNGTYPPGQSPVVTVTVITP